MSAGLSMTLEHRGWPHPPRPERRYDPEHDNIMSLLADVGEALASDRTIRFKVSGFGDDAWPVDIRTDLVVVVQQVPAAIASLRSARELDLDFFEQGVERFIHGAVRGTSVTLTCRSFTKWEPNPSTVEMEVEPLLAMLVAFLAEFESLLGACCPWAPSHPWVVDWLKPARAA